jgi:NADH-quinone oxidoreductase subunit N
MIGPVAGQGPMRDGVAALLFYIAVYGAMNLGAFAVLSIFRTPDDREMETLDDLAGLARRAPLPALALAICVFSLMGLPPTAGFLGKLYIFSSAFSLGDAHAFRIPLMYLAVIGVLNTAVGAAFYLRMVSAAYVRGEVSQPRPLAGASLRWGLALCALPMLLLFIRPTPLIAEARKATVSLQQTSQLPATRLTAEAAAPDVAR